MKIELLRVRIDAKTEDHVSSLPEELFVSVRKVLLANYVKTAPR